MDYRVIITDTAKGDLREIAFVIADLSQSIDTARKLVKGIQEKCNSLQQFSLAGALPKDYILRSAGYRYLTYKSYVIFYEVDHENRIVRIVAVFHEKLDYMRAMKDFM